jgi:hypothetical protein
MRTYIANFIPKYKQFSKKLDNEALLMNQHWVMVDDTTNNRTVYIFQAGNRLLLSTNGKVNQARWEMIDSDHILVSIGSDSYMFKHGFLNDQVLALCLDGSSRYALFVNSDKVGSTKTINNPKSVKRLLIGSISIGGAGGSSGTTGSDGNTSDLGCSCMVWIIAIAISVALLLALK